MPPTKSRLNPRARKVLQFILQYKLEHDGIAPSIREIIAGTEVPSTSMVHYYLGILEDAGRIQLLRDGYGNQIARGIAIPGASWSPPAF